MKLTSYQAAPEFAHILRAASDFGNPLDSMTAETVPLIRKFREEEARKVLHEIPLAEIRELAIPGRDGKIPAWLHRPLAKIEKAPILIFFHGGGWTLGSPDTHASIVKALASRVPAIVVAVKYRLAPEHPFPAGLDDAHQAADWVFRNAEALGGDPAHIGLVGDSAGANLAIVVARRLHRAGRKIALQALLYPSTDLGHFETASHREFGHGHLLTNESLRRFRDFYVKPAEDCANPEISPIHFDDCDLADSPNSLVIVAGCDPLREEGIAYAQKLAKNGVPVKLQVLENMVHGFLRYFNTDPKASPLVETILNNICREIRDMANLNNHLSV